LLRSVKIKNLKNKRQITSLLILSFKIKAQYITTNLLWCLTNSQLRILITIHLRLKTVWIQSRIDWWQKHFQNLLSNQNWNNKIYLTSDLGHQRCRRSRGEYHNKQSKKFRTTDQKPHPGKTIKTYTQGVKCLPTRHVHIVIEISIKEQQSDTYQFAPQ